MKGSYNTVAPVYDSLSRLVFGSTIIAAQKFSLHAISSNSTILIVGGGTGWILEELAHLYPQGLDITYVDISEKMISLAKERKVGDNKVAYINQAIQNFNTTARFDVVMTPFLLDNFLPQTADGVFQKIHELLIFGGIWLFTDFQVVKEQACWQKPFLKMMYSFFKITCNIEANELPDVQSLFSKFGYEKLSSKTFFYSFINSSVYAKAGKK